MDNPNSLIYLNLIKIWFKLKQNWKTRLKIERETKNQMGFLSFPFSFYMIRYKYSCIFFHILSYLNYYINFDIFFYLYNLNIFICIYIVFILFFMWYYIFIIFYYIIIFVCCSTLHDHKYTMRWRMVPLAMKECSMALESCMLIWYLPLLIVCYSVLTRGGKDNKEKNTYTSTSIFNCFPFLGNCDSGIETTREPFRITAKNILPLGQHCPPWLLLSSNYYILLTKLCNLSWLSPSKTLVESTRLHFTSRRTASLHSSHQSWINIAMCIPWILFPLYNKRKFKP